MKKAFAALVLIMLVAAFFRLWDLKNIPPGLWSDEAMNGTNALVALEQKDWKVFYPENFGREGLFINIQSLFVAVLGNEPWVLRLPSAIFGILTVLGLYLMTKELFGIRVALTASFFLATLFWHINFSRIGFRAIMAPFFLVWAFYFLFLAMRKSKEWFFAVAGFVFGLGVHSYIAYRVAPIIALLPLWKFYTRQKLAHLGGRENYCAPCAIGLFIFMAFLAALPLLWYYAQNPQDFFGRTAGISILGSREPLAQFSENVVKTAQMFFLFGDFNWRHNFAGEAELWWPVAILFLIGIWVSIKKFQWPNNFVLLWLVVMILPVALSNESLPHALRSIVLIPPAMIFAALGLEWISRKIRPQLKVFIFIFLITATLNAYNQYFLRWAPNFNVYQAFQTDLTEKAHWLNSQPNNIKKYIITNAVDQVDTSGTPMSFQPIIFITNTASPAKQTEKNIYYLAYKDIERIDCNAPCLIVSPDKHPIELLRQIKQKIPGLRLDASPGFVVLKKLLK